MTRAVLIGSDISSVPADEWWEPPPLAPEPSGLRWDGVRVDCKVIDVQGHPHCPLSHSPCMPSGMDKGLLHEAIVSHQRDGWVVACISRLDSCEDHGTPLRFPLYRIILVRREVDGNPQDLQPAPIPSDR